MRFGLRIPSFAWPELTHHDAMDLGAYCRQVDSLPFENIWVIDHLLEAPAVTGSPGSIHSRCSRSWLASPNVLGSGLPP
jgi:hypothetical protein